MGAVGHAMMRTLGLWARRVLPWLLRYPFILSPATWAILLAFALMLGIGGLVLGTIPVAFVGLLAFLAVAAALAGWRRLLAEGSRPLLFLAQFRPETPGAEEASLNHQIAMRRRLAKSVLIAERVELRDIPAPIHERETERLLRAAVTGHGVVRGSVQAMGNVGSFEAVLTYRNPESGQRDVVDENQRRHNKVAIHHKVGTDYQVQLAELVGPHFRARHADGIEGMLLLLIAEDHLELGEYPKADACLKAAETFRDHMPDAGKRHLTLARTFIDHRHNLRAAIKALANAPEGSSPELRAAAAWLSMIGLQRGGVTAHQAVRECRRAVQVAPEDEMLRVWLTDALVEAKKPDEALAELKRLTESNHLLEHDPNIVQRMGAIEYNRRNFERAKTIYEDLVAMNPTARSHLYLADALLNLDQIPAARYHYRQALLLQPDLVDAHRGYWWKVPQGEQATEGLFDKLFLFVARTMRRLPMRPRIELLYLLLRWHYKRHPEDSRVHFMLGAHALLRKDLATAEQRLVFANELVGGIDTEAIARLVLVYLLQGRRDKAGESLQALKTVEHGHPPTPTEIQERAVNLYLPILEVKDLLTRDEQLWLAGKVQAWGG